ncbi:MAG: WYL domain-containing protein [Spirochaetaceae bacterium]|nr:MAG: WYL domain-containing protein [Spirochaetaceae bacterium]
MSIRSIMQRFAYIDNRLRYRKDYPSARMLAEGLREQYGETPAVRTIQRDIEKLRDRGAPIEYDPTRHGYFYTDENWQLPGIVLTEGDLMGLMVADRALVGYRNSPFYDDLRSVFDRLTRQLPQTVTVSSDDLIANVSVITDPVTQIREGIWTCIRRAMSEHRSIAIEYRAPGYADTVARIVDPLHLVGHGGEWYLLCWSHHNKDIRIFALNRIRKASARAETFTRPAEFSVERYIDPAFGVFVGEESADVAVRFFGEAASKIPERTWHPGQTVEQHDDGSITVRFRTNQQSQVLFWVSAWGPNAEILEPPELRANAAEWFRATAGRYT